MDIAKGLFLISLMWFTSRLLHWSQEMRFHLNVEQFDKFLVSFCVELMYSFCCFLTFLFSLFWTRVSSSCGFFFFKFLRLWLGVCPSILYFILYFVKLLNFQKKIPSFPNGLWREYVVIYNLLVSSFDKNSSWRQYFNFYFISKLGHGLLLNRRKKMGKKKKNHWVSATLPYASSYLEKRRIKPKKGIRNEMAYRIDSFLRLTKLINKPFCFSILYACQLFY